KYVDLYDYLYGIFLTVPPKTVDEDSKEQDEYMVHYGPSLKFSGINDVYIHGAYHQEQDFVKGSYNLILGHSQIMMALMLISFHGLLEAEVNIDFRYLNTTTPKHEYHMPISDLLINDRICATTFTLPNNMLWIHSLGAYMKNGLENKIYCELLVDEYEFTWVAKQHELIGVLFFACFYFDVSNYKEGQGVGIVIVSTNAVEFKMPLSERYIEGLLK
ncbi:hypothetical protein ACJX0J_007422, partial [Zea mays]